MASKKLTEKYGAGGKPIYEFLCDTEACKEELDVENITAGSTAYVAETKKKYILNNAKTWCEM